MATNYQIQIRTFKEEQQLNEEFIIYENSSLPLVKATMEEILSKKHPLCEKIKNPSLPYYFLARIIRDNNPKIIVADWHISKSRNIVIEYSVLLDNLSWSEPKQFPPCPITDIYLPANIQSKNALNIAKDFLELELDSLEDCVVKILKIYELKNENELFLLLMQLGYSKQSLKEYQEIYSGNHKEIYTMLQEFELID